MVLCLEGSVIFMPHRKNQRGNPVNITNVLIWNHSLNWLLPNSMVSLLFGDLQNGDDIWICAIYNLYLLAIDQIHIPWAFWLL